MDSSRAPLSLRFGPFAFDEADARLVAHGRAVALAPKAFGVLAELLRKPGQLVTKDALLDGVWGHRHVSESVLKTTISELRAALGDDAKNPDWVETASRRGYRFIGSIESVLPTTAQASPGAAAIIHAAPGLIGRAPALARLHASWARASGGQRQLCFVAGEAGIGKTSLIDAFIATLGDVVVAHGQCIEQVGEGEPYLPILDALSCLARADASLLALMRRVTPTWLVQLPWLIEREERERLQAGLANSTQDRMLREFSEMVEQLTATRPLLLVTEDLHWCDEATVRLIDHVARRRPAARLMWLATYRTPELVAKGHPLNGLRHELRAHRLCDEVLLDPFSETELAAYLAVHRPELAAEEAQVRRLHRQTDGLPLFIVNAVDELASPTAADALSEDWPVPDSLVGIIERQHSRLAPDDAALLEAAAVCGVQFECSVVAGMLERESADVAAHCDELVRRLMWLAPAEVDTLADGTLDARFTFRHALYRQALYQRIAPPARTALHRRAASAIGRVRSSQVDAFAAVLAFHHERGLDALGAMRAYATAGERALGRFAPREALLLAGRGLALLERNLDGDTRLEAELALQRLRSTALAQSSGVSTHEARAAYRRCAELCELLPPARSRSWVILGLVWMFIASGEYDEAEAMALRLRAAADAFDDPQLRAAATVAQAVPLLQRGRVREAATLAQQAHELTQALAHPRLLPPTVMHDISALAFSIGAVAHALCGDGELAQRWVDSAITRAEQLGQPMALGFATRCANLVDVLFDRPDAVFARAHHAFEVMHEHRYEQGMGLTLVMLGWARARIGDGVRGLSEVEEGCLAHAATGTLFEGSSLRRLAADTALAVGDLASAGRHLDEGFALAASIGEVLHLPSLWITRANLLARKGDAAGARAAAQTAAALALASGALAVELVARLALCEFPGSAATDLQALRELRERWLDAAPWPTLSRVDTLLAGVS